MKILIVPSRACGAGTHGQSSACGALTFDFDFDFFFLADLNGFLHILNGLKSR
jgi:hypothetical protein